MSAQDSTRIKTSLLTCAVMSRTLVSRENGTI